MRLLADENVSRLVIERLRTCGFEVISVSDTKKGAPDTDVLSAADAEGCILITEDRDFGELVIRQRLSVRGVILLELDRLSNAAEAGRGNRGGRAWCLAVTAAGASPKFAGHEWE